VNLFLDYDLVICKCAVIEMEQIMLATLYAITFSQEVMAAVWTIPLAIAALAIAWGTM
jgi:hypothetical protein